MRVALIGPPQSGKSTLFAAVAQAGGSHIDISRPDQPHLAVVKVPDERLNWLAEQYSPKKVTPAELEFLDLPGLDLSDQSNLSRARSHWPEMRQSDMLVLVLRDFTDPSVPLYRNRTDPQADLEELLAEMLFADLDQVAGRIEKLQAALRKPSGKQDHNLRELELMERLKQGLESDQPISSAIRDQQEEKLIRSFAFLSSKPTLVVLNVDESSAGRSEPSRLMDLECISLSAQIERELAQLSPLERSAFLVELGIASPASDRLIRACYRLMDLVSFLTVGPDECRAWTIRRGTHAVEAAGEIHSDIARGFIRAETVSFQDLHSAGDMKAARSAGKVRLEGKNYVVNDGDVINFRFNV